jgi:type 1 glutamine amidotransferase
MIGGYFDEHPWVTFDAPIVVEDPNFPGMQQWPTSFVLKDEIYQMKDYSRDKVRVLMRLDASKLDLNNPHVHRKDRDFAVTWQNVWKGASITPPLGPSSKMGRSSAPKNVLGGYQVGDGLNAM